MPFAFSKKLGITQGQITPVGWVPPDGDYVFCLGSDVPNDFDVIAPDDSIKVEQDKDVGATTIVRVKARVRGPSAALPAGYFWEANALVDGGAHWRYVIPTGADNHDFLDIRLAIGPLGGGSIPIGFMLRLVSTGPTAPIEVELPAFYVDALLFEDATTPQILLGNRFPEPNETRVLVNASIQFDLIDRTNATPPVCDQVYVEGVLAFNAGVFQAGFSGSNNLGPDGIRRVVVNPAVDWTSEQEVTVRVVAHDAASSYSLDESYSFTVQDVEAPDLVSVEALALKTLRVTFSEVMQAEDATDAADALYPAAYVLGAQGSPAVEPSVASVTLVSGTVFDLTTSIPLSPGVQYLLTVSGATDQFGNVVAAPTNAQSFVAFMPVQPAGRAMNLYQLMAPAIKRADRRIGLDLKKFLDVLQEVLTLILNDIDQFAEILDPDFAPEAFVDLMLRDLGNPFGFELTLEDKRRLLRVLMEVYQKKGTNKGIEDVVRFFLGLEVTVLDYWVAEVLGLGDWELGEDWVLGADPGSPGLYSFEVVSLVELTDEQKSRISEIANYMKPGHTHLIRVAVPEPDEEINHVELGLSDLDDTFILHE